MYKIMHIMPSSSSYVVISAYPMQTQFIFKNTFFMCIFIGKFIFACNVYYN